MEKIWSKILPPGSRPQTENIEATVGANGEQIVLSAVPARITGAYQLQDWMTQHLLFTLPFTQVLVRLGAGSVLQRPQPRSSVVWITEQPIIVICHFLFPSSTRAIIIYSWIFLAANYGFVIL